MFTWFKQCWNKPKPPEYRIIQDGVHSWTIQQWMRDADDSDYYDISDGHKTLTEAEEVLSIIKNPTIKYY